MSAKVTSDYLTTEFQNKELTRVNAIVVREKTIAVADTKALSDQKAAFEKRLKKELKERDELNAILAKHKDGTIPWCVLDSYELCYWNRQNRFVFQDDPNAIAECSRELSNSPASEGRNSGQLVGK